MPMMVVSMQRLLIAIASAAALCLAVWLGFSAGDSRPVGAPAIPTRKTKGSEAAKTDGPVGPQAGVVQDTPTDPAKPMTTMSGSPATAPEASTLSGPEVIEQWMSSTDIPGIARAILAGFPKLDPKDHLLAVSKLAPLVGDEQFDSLKRLAVDPATSADAKEYLFHDAVNRSAEAKWPMMFAIMAASGHPQAQEAHQALVSDLGADYGANQGQWLARIQADLKERAQIGK
ncbi:MAG: hypothetical protein JWO08_2330 [Verrucomicrobiaceae bacterium]|nr:hypothetical protein [Verrucomicrobiaceae bacterium]